MDPEQRTLEFNDYIGLDEVYTQKGYYEEVGGRDASGDASGERMRAHKVVEVTPTQRTLLPNERSGHMNPRDYEIPEMKKSTETMINTQVSDIYSVVQKIQEKKPSQVLKKNISTRKINFWLTFAVAILWAVTIIFIAIVSGVIAKINTKLESNITPNTASGYKQLQVEDSANQTASIDDDTALLKEMLKSYINNSAEIAAVMKILDKNTNTLEKFALINSVGKRSSNPAHSCAAILQADPFSTSGYYWVMGSNGSAVRVYCAMTALCDSAVKGWQKITEENRTAPSYPYSNADWCACTTYRCTTVTTLPILTKYSHICGKIMFDKRPYKNAIKLLAGSQTLWASSQVPTSTTAPPCPCFDRPCLDNTGNCWCDCFNIHLLYHTSDNITMICKNIYYYNNIGISYLDLYIQ